MYKLLSAMGLIMLMSVSLADEEINRKSIDDLLVAYGNTLDTHRESESDNDEIRRLNNVIVDLKVERDAAQLQTRRAIEALQQSEELRSKDRVELLLYMYHSLMYFKEHASSGQIDLSLFDHEIENMVMQLHALGVYDFETEKEE